MESKPRNNIQIIALIAANLLVPVPLALLILNFADSAVGILVAAIVSTFLMYHILLRIQTRIRRRVFLFSHWGIAAAWALLGVYMLLVAFPRAQRPYCGLTGLGEALFAVLCFFVAVVLAICLALAMLAARNRREMSMK